MPCFSSQATQGPDRASESEELRRPEDINSEARGKHESWPADPNRLDAYLDLVSAVEPARQTWESTFPQAPEDAARASDRDQVVQEARACATPLSRARLNSASARV